MSTHGLGLKTLQTWDRRSTFSYHGSVKEGVTITYGAKQRTLVSASIFSRMLKHFEGKIVDCGTSRDKPQLGSLGEWLQDNVTKTAIASYVSAILVNEGWANKIGSKIEFK